MFTTLDTHTLAYASGLGTEVVTVAAIMVATAVQVISTTSPIAMSILAWQVEDAVTMAAGTAVAGTDGNAPRAPVQHIQFNSPRNGNSLRGASLYTEKWLDFDLQAAPNRAMHRAMHLP